MPRPYDAPKRRGSGYNISRINKVAGTSVVITSRHTKAEAEAEARRQRKKNDNPNFRFVVHKKLGR